MNSKVFFVRLLLSGILLLTIFHKIPAQEKFQKPSRRNNNMLDINASFLKTIYSFEPAYFDTIPQPGPDPLLIAKFREKDLIPPVFNAVFDAQAQVYDPNFWGSVPQLIDKLKYNKFDTLKILDYLSAGWDTSLMIEDDGNMKNISEYRKIPYEEISGIFFYESWWLDSKSLKIYKDIIAYLPIREYTTTPFDGFENTEVRRRLLFMVLPEWTSGNKKPVKYKSSNFHLIKKNISYEIPLYNKSYEEYLYREEEYGQISEAEYNEWQYHRFDFYRHFDPDILLEKIISAVLKENIQAFLVGPEKKPLNRDEFINLVFSSTESPESPISQPDMLPENYPVSDLNSITFQEDWYINPENLQIYKDIKALTINRTESQFDKYTGDYIRGSVKPLFTIWFQ